MDSSRFPAPPEATSRSSPSQADEGPHLFLHHYCDECHGTRGGDANDQAFTRLLTLIEEPAEAAELEIWQEFRKKNRARP